MNKSPTFLTFYLVIFYSVVLSKCLEVPRLQWGDKCTVPKHGFDEESVKTHMECDAGKGLICNGEACVCTYSQRYSMDHVSKECRRKVGKPCQYVDTALMGQDALDKLPFNLKCHENAACVQLNLPARGGVVDIEKMSMCLCRPGFRATPNFDACIIPPPELEMAPLPPPRRQHFKNTDEYPDSD